MVANSAVCGAMSGIRRATTYEGLTIKSLVTINNLNCLAGHHYFAYLDADKDLLLATRKIFNSKMSQRVAIETHQRFVSYQELRSTSILSRSAPGMKARIKTLNRLIKLETFKVRLNEVYSHHTSKFKLMELILAKRPKALFFL